MIQITAKGKQYLNDMDNADGIFPNEIHLLSGLRDGKRHLVIDFEKYNYIDPSLEKCLNYLYMHEYIVRVF